jgi:hypothetical protein
MTALTNQRWRARWIQAPDTPGTRKAENLWSCFRRTFSLPARASSAVARIAVDSKYWLWVNGRLAVFEGGLKRGPNPHDTYFDKIELAPWLHAGENQIAVLAWYWGRDGYSHKSSGRPGFLFELRAGPTELVSDASWKSIRHPAFGETGDPRPNYRLPEFNVHYDARRAPGDWLAPGFDDSTWANARDAGSPPDAPWNNLVLRPTPLWRDSGLVPYENPAAHPKITDGTPVIATLPRNLTITPYFKIKAAAGLLIDIRTDNYRGGSEYNLRAEYITRDGEQEFETPAYLNGHAVIHTFPAGIEILDLRYRETRYDSDFTGYFECDDPFLNRLWLKCRNTMNINMRDSIQDPDRERAQWWGDAAIILGEIFYSCDPRAHALIRKAILDLVNWRKANGVLHSPVPAGSCDAELPGQMLASIGEHGFWYYYRYTGDDDAIAYAYPAVRDYLALWEIGPDGLLVHRSGGWDWGDWGENIDRPVMDNALLYQALGAAIGMARVTAHEEEIPGYETKRASIAANYNRVLWQGSEYRSPGYTGKTDDRGHGLALLYGLAGPEQWPAIKTVLTTSFEATPYMEKYILESLFRSGDTEGALTRLKKRYQNMVESELSTLWEGWGMGPGWGIGPEGYGGGSYNHGWSGGPLTMLGEYVAGISPTTPGFATYQVKPQLGPLRHVRAGVDSVRGRIEIEIDRDESGFRLRLVSQPDTLATVVLPAGASVECNNHAVWPTTGEDTPLGGVKCHGEDAGHIRFTVPPGTWEFLSRQRP